MTIQSIKAECQRFGTFGSSTPSALGGWLVVKDSAIRRNLLEEPKVPSQTNK
jgi:hypothetical protein